MNHKIVNTFGELGDRSDPRATVAISIPLYEYAALRQYMDVVRERSGGYFEEGDLTTLGLTQEQACDFLGLTWRMGLYFCGGDFIKDGEHYDGCFLVTKREMALMELLQENMRYENGEPDENNPNALEQAYLPLGVESRRRLNAG